MDRSDGRQTTGCTVDQRTLDTTGWCDTVLRVKVDGVLQVIVPDFECKDPRLCANALNDKINGATVTGITTGGDMINGGIGTMTIVSDSVGDTNCESVPGYLPWNSDWIRAPNPNAQGVHCINGKALDMDSESDTYGEKLDWYGSRIEIIPTYVSELWFGTNLQVTNGWTPPIKTKTCKCCTSLSMVDDRYFDINTNESKSIAWSTDMKYYQKSVESAQIMPNWVGRNFTEVSWFASCEDNNNNNINGVPQDNDGYQWRAMNYAECDKVLKENWDYLLCALNIVKTYELSENVGAFGWLNDGQYSMNPKAKTKWATLSGNAEDRAPRSFSTCMKNIRSQSNTGWFSDFWNYRYYYEQYMGGFSDVVHRRTTNDKPRGCFLEASPFLGTTWTTDNAYSQVVYNPSGDSTTPCNDPDSLGSNTMLCTCIKQEMIQPTPEPTKTVATQYTNVISAREEEQMNKDENGGWDSRKKPYRQVPDSWDGRSASIHRKHENICGLTGCNTLGDTCNEGEDAKTCCEWQQSESTRQRPFAWTDVDVQLAGLETNSPCLETDVDTSVIHPLSQIQRFINTLNCTITAPSFYASCNIWENWLNNSNRICPGTTNNLEDGNCQPHNLTDDGTTSWQGSTSKHCTNGVYEIETATTATTTVVKKVCKNKHTIFLEEERCPLNAGQINFRGACHAIEAVPIEICGFEFVDTEKKYTGIFDISNYGAGENQKVCKTRVGADFSVAQQNVHANTLEDHGLTYIDEWWNKAVFNYCKNSSNTGGHLYKYNMSTRTYTFVPRVGGEYDDNILEASEDHINVIYECFLECNTCSNYYSTPVLRAKMIQTISGSESEWPLADCVESPTTNGLECYSDCDECNDITEGTNHADCIRHHPNQHSPYEFRKWRDCQNQDFINNFAWDSRGTAVDIRLVTDEQGDSPISKNLHTVGDYEIKKVGNMIVVSQNIRLEGQRLELTTPTIRSNTPDVLGKVYTHPTAVNFQDPIWKEDLTSITLVQTNSIYEYRIEIELFNGGSFNQDVLQKETDGSWSAIDDSIIDPVAGDKCDVSYQEGAGVMCCPVETNDFYNEWNTNPDRQCLVAIYEITQGLDTNADNFQIYDQTIATHKFPLQGYYLGLDFTPGNFGTYSNNGIDWGLGYISVFIDGTFGATFQISWDCTSIEKCKDGFQQKFDDDEIQAKVTVVTSPYNGKQVLRIESKQIGTETTISSVDIGCPYNEGPDTLFQSEWEGKIFQRKCSSKYADNTCYDNFGSILNVGWRPCGSSFMQSGLYFKSNNDQLDETLSCRSCSQALKLFGSMPSKTIDYVTLDPVEEMNRHQDWNIEALPDTHINLGLNNGVTTDLTQKERDGLKRARGGRCAQVGSTLYHTDNTLFTCCEGDEQPGANWSATNYHSPRDPVKHFWRKNSDITKAVPCRGLNTARQEQKQTWASNYNKCIEGSPCLFTFSNLGDECDDPDGEKMQCCESGWKKIGWQGLGNPVTGCGAWTKTEGNYFLDDLPIDKTTPKAHHNIFVMDEHPVVLTIQAMSPCVFCPTGKAFTGGECDNCLLGYGVTANGICEQCSTGKFQPGTDYYNSGAGTSMGSIKLPEKDVNGTVSNRKDGVKTKNECIELGTENKAAYVSWSVRPFGSFGDTQGQLGSNVSGVRMMTSKVQMILVTNTTIFISLNSWMIGQIYDLMSPTPLTPVIMVITLNGTMPLTPMR